MKKHIWTVIALAAVFSLISGGVPELVAGVENLAPPAEPEVAPMIASAYSNDLNHNKIDDALESKAAAAMSRLKAAVTTEKKIEAQALLASPVEVELIFNRQITQNQIDEFLGRGGEIAYIYKAVSYGWNGRISLEEVNALPSVMGAEMVLVQEAKPVVLHLDMATQTGRVRPVWAPGFAGSASGYDGDDSITIAIVDTGIDAAHSDLSGRQRYWRDFTSDGALSPIDMIEHGSHVAGIAVGTGAASGSGTGTLYFTDAADLTGVPSGAFYPFPIGLPDASITFTSTAQWMGGGSASLYQVYHTKGISGGWTAISPPATGTSPQTETNTFTGSSSLAYSTALPQNAGETVQDFVIVNSVTNYPGVGDGFNKLRGVAPASWWAAAKVFTNAGEGISTWISAAIDDLVSTRVANNIKVMNMSIGTVGDPGLDTALRLKVNTAVNNGIVVVVSAGNDGLKSTSGGREIDDPGRAALALTVAACNDEDQLTNYSSHGFSSPDPLEDYKPDITAPGGSASYYTDILSVDSGSADGAFTDQQSNDYASAQGTSMASPFAAGAAALVIDAMQQQGIAWDFGSSQHARYVKMLLCATATETNKGREGGSYNPTLQRASGGPSSFPAGKDPYEGYGILNPDAAVEAVTLTYTVGTTAGDTLGPGASDRRAWARKVHLNGGEAFEPTLIVPSSGDFDLYLYSTTPGLLGTPVILASSTLAGSNYDEHFSYVPPADTDVLLVVKRVSGSGTFSFCTPPEQASNPVPNDHATGVDITTELSWTTGLGAASHDVYFGTASPPPFVGNQTGTTFNPGTLSYCTTYYWRIDERNACSVTTGNLWSFTTIVTAPGQATDPSPANSATGVSINEDLSWTAGSSATSHDVYFGTVSPPPFVGNQSGTTFDPGTLEYCTTYYWRIDERNPCSVTIGNLWSFTTIVAAPGQANNPNPADSATDVSIDKDLIWTAGSSVTSHDVYFGTVSPPPFVRNQPGTTFDPGTLSYSRTYYWRIDERNGCGVAPGEEWRFKTVAAPKYDLTVNSTFGGIVTQPGVGSFLDYNMGDVVDLNVIAAEGWNFKNWSGNTGAIANVSSPVTTIVMNGNYTIQANFESTQIQGEIIGWGENTYGQAGVPIVDILFMAVSGGYYHSLGLRTDGSIAANGRNDYGQCNVPEGNDFNAIAAGGRHSLGLKTDGSIAAWGHNGYGQCDVPAPNTSFIAIAAGYSHSLGLKADGSIVAWGRNDFGQCTVPTPNSGFIAVAAGSYHSLGLKWNGKIVAWGYNAYGQCNVPIPNSNFKAVEGGAYHSLGLKQDGSIAAWGSNSQGQCTVPTPNSGFMAVSGGAYHSMGLKSGGAVVAWGYNASGQCTVPAPNSSFMAISAGGEQSLALRTSNIVIYGGNVNYSNVYQQIEGFGGAICYDMYPMANYSNKQAVYDLLFRDLGLDILRIKNTYQISSAEVNATAKIVEAGKLRNPALKTLLVPWSPPANLKNTGTVGCNYNIDPENCYGTLKQDITDSNNSAPYYYVYNEYAKWWLNSLTGSGGFFSQGVYPDYISIQNEPDWGIQDQECMFDPTENEYNAGYDRAFEAVFNKLDGNISPMPKILAPETGDLINPPSFINALINRGQINNIYGFSHHLYNQNFNNPDDAGQIFRMQNFKTNFGDYYDKPSFMTEYGGSGTPNFAMAIYLAQHIYNCLVYEGVTSYVHWTLIRDGSYTTGGIINLVPGGSYIVRDLYWFIKAYSRYTDPGWFIVGSSAVSDDIRITAFKNPAGTALTVVILNKSDNTEGLMLYVNGFSPLSSKVYRSSQSEHWLYLGAFNPSQQVICPKKSITTISLLSGLYEDCNETLATGHRLEADIGGSGDCYVNFADFAVLTGHWLDTTCVGPGNCDGADFEPTDGVVDIYDMSDFADQWLTCNDPANPNCSPNW